MSKVYQGLNDINVIRWSWQWAVLMQQLWAWPARGVRTISQAMMRHWPLARAGRHWPLAWKTLARPGRHWPLSWQTLATPGRHWPRLEDTGHWSGILCPLAWQTLARPGRHVLARPGRHGPGQGNMGEVPAGGQDSQDRHNTSLIRIFYIYIFFFKYKKLLATRDPWQVTGDIWHMTHSVGWTFSQNFSSLALPLWDWHCIEDIWTKGWMN